MIKFLLCTLTNNGQPFISVSRISKCCVTAPQAQTPRPPADGQSVRQHDNIKETERQLCGLMTSPGRLESAMTTSRRNRASHRNLLRIWCTHLSAVCGGSAATRLTATNRPEYSHVSGASRWTVPLFQTIRYEK